MAIISAYNVVVLNIKRTHGLSGRELELARLLMEDCNSTGDIQEILKRLFASTIVHNA